MQKCENSNNIQNDMFHNLQVQKDNISYDLISYFFSQRVIWFFQPVTDTSAYQLCSQLLYLSKLNNQPIYLNIQSGGGSVYACLSIINTMQTTGCPIYVTVCGFAASAASVITAFGTKGHRCALPHARIMLHQVNTELPRTSYKDFEINFKETQYINELLLKLLFDRMNISKEEFETKVTRDWFMSAEEALKAGIIDKIVEVTPSSTTNTNDNTTTNTNDINKKPVVKKSSKTVTNNSKSNTKSNTKKTK